MSLNADLIELTQPGATGNQTYNLAAGFDPKAIIIFGTPQAADGSIASWAYGIGFATYRVGNVQQRFCAMRSLDAAASADLGGSQGSDAAFVIMTQSAGGNSRDLEIDLVSMTNAGTPNVILNWVNLHTTASIKIWMLVLGGSDITDAIVDAIPIAASGTTVDYVPAIGFGKPDFIFSAGVFDTDTFSAGTPQLSVGFAKQGEAGRGFGFVQTDGNTASIVAASQRSDRIFQRIAPAGASRECMSRLDTVIANWPTDGVRLIHDAVPSFATSMPALFLKGTFQAATGSGTAPTSGGLPVVVDHACGFAPKVGFNLGWNLAAATGIDTASADSIAFGIGAYDGTDEAWAGFTEDDAALTMDSNQQRTNTKFVRNYNQAAALQSEADGAFSGNNLRLSWNDIDTVAREYQWFALGDAAASGTTYTKAGSLTAGSISAGADASEHSEAGSLTSTSRGSAADVSERSETGALATATRSSAADVVESSETGSLRASGLVSGGRLRERSGSGSLLASALLAGVDVAERSESGSLRAFALASGVDVSERSELGALIAGVTLQGADTFESSETGSLRASGLVSGPKAKEHPVFGSLLSAGRLSGADVIEHGEAGSLTPFALSIGADTSERAETGSIRSSGLLSGADAREAAETGSLRASGFVSGADAMAYAEAASIVAQVLLQGTDAATRSELGSILAGTILSGASVKAVAGKSGSITASSLVSGADAETRSKSGSLLATALASGADVHEASELGSLIAGTFGSAADARVAVESGSLQSSTLLAGVRAKEHQSSGSLLASAKLSGSILKVVAGIVRGLFRSGRIRTSEEGRIVVEGGQGRIVDPGSAITGRISTADEGEIPSPRPGTIRNSSRRSNQ